MGYSNYVFKRKGKKKSALHDEKDHDFIANNQASSPVYNSINLWTNRTAHLKINILHRNQETKCNMQMHIVDYLYHKFYFKPIILCETNTTRAQKPILLHFVTAKVMFKHFFNN